MSLSHLTLAQLNQAVALLKERESLQSKIQQVDRQLREIENGKTTTFDLTSREENRAIATGKTTRRRRRKNIQQAVLAVLKKVGTEGLTVKELAFRAKVKATSLRTWLYTKGKTIEEIARKDGGLFSYKSR